MRSALIHRAHVRRRLPAGPKNALGERPPLEVVDGPMFRARLMMPRGGGAETRDGDTGAARTRVQYELLADLRDLVGGPVVLLPSDEVVAFAPVLAPAGIVLQIDGVPEHLTDGRREIGWNARAVAVDRTG